MIIFRGLHRIMQSAPKTTVSLWFNLSKSSTFMQLTIKDRVILANQYQILAGLDERQSQYYLEKVKILTNGYSYLYDSLNINFCKEMTYNEGKFVVDILDLYELIEDVKRKTQYEKIINHPYGHFNGFCGNYESAHLGFCHFLVNDQNKFQVQKKYFSKNDGMNSHFPMVEKYKKMINFYSSIKKDTVFYELTVEQAVLILEA
jgi:uncharacterized protein YfbU (UPF0304 family)